MGARLARRVARGVKTLASNPVLVRDLRVMFRGRRAFVSQAGYLGFLGMAMGAAVLLYAAQGRWYGGAVPNSLSEYGRWAFFAMFETQVALLWLEVVGYSAGSVALEMEKRTYDMLAVTRLSSAEVVFGKVTSITLLCWLLLFTSVPLAFFSMLLGGVSPGQIALSYGMLAYKIPLWASIGVLVSVVARRTVTAYVATLVFLAGEFTVSAAVSVQPQAGMGLMNPALALDNEGFRLFARDVPGWPHALLLGGLLTGLTAVAAAEAMPNYGPKRSAWLRGLLLGLTFCFFFLSMAGALGPPAGLGGLLAGSAGEAMVGGVATLWLWVCVLVLFYTSYPPSGASEPRGPGGLLSAMWPRRWFAREPESGVWICLLFWVVGLVAVVVPAAIYDARDLLANRAAGLTWLPAPVLYAAMLGASLIAYALWGTVFGVKCRRRSLAGLLSLLFITAMNLMASLYVECEGVTMRQPPNHPALVLASPLAAAEALCSTSTIWDRYSAAQCFIYGFGYSVVLAAGALLVLRWLRRHATRTE